MELIDLMTTGDNPGRLGITLVKIFARSLKILEDLHEDPSADL